MTARPLTMRATTAAAFGAIAALMSACAPTLSPAANPGPPTPTIPVSPTPTSQSTMSQHPDPTASTPATAPQPSRAVATRRGSLEQVPVTATVFPLMRSGDLASINVVISSTSGRAFRILEHLSDHNPELSARRLRTVDGVRLLDSRQKKAYLPATTSTGECLCSPANTDMLERYTELTISVVFASPPPDLEHIDVVIPVFGTVTDVPIR